MKQIFILFLISFSVLSISKEVASKQKKTQPAITEKSHGGGIVFTEKSKLWLGLGAGFIFGFGSGQAVQGRWREEGWYFTAADGLGLLMLLSGFGDSRDGRSAFMSTVVTSGSVIFIVSRILQVVELSIYGVRHGIFEGASTNKHSSYFENDRFTLKFKRPEQDFVLSQNVLVF